VDKKASIVRFTTPELESGPHKYMVQVLKEGQVVYHPPKMHRQIFLRRNSLLKKLILKTNFCWAITWKKRD
jgi:exosome complex RNA-binding protein Rrp4